VNSMKQCNGKEYKCFQCGAMFPCYAIHLTKKHVKDHRDICQQCTQNFLTWYDNLTMKEQRIATIKQWQGAYLDKTLDN